MAERTTEKMVRQHTPSFLTSSGALPYVLPFGLFLLLLGIQQLAPVPQPARFLLIASALLVFSRPVLGMRFANPVGSVALGCAVFAIWIAPDLLIPGYRNFWLFSNGVLGHPVGSTSAGDKLDAGFLIFRVLTSFAVVPIIEELFWRGWLMRWLIHRDFESVPLGSYTAESFWLVAVLFASEHGSYWEVGLVAGIAYNWWMIRTRSLWDCILAHAVTNALLAWYVIGRGQWQYWL